MVKFKKWLESYPTQSIHQASTQRDVNKPVAAHNSDAAVSASELQGIHGKLTQIYGNVNSKPIFKSNLDKESFKKHLLTGLDGIGRAHIILKPSAIGVR